MLPLPFSREGKLDVLKELCLEHKDGDYIHTALKSKDKFGQTPMLSSISASENRNEILKFLLNLILERSSDTALQEVEKLTNTHIHISPVVSGGDPCPKQTPRFHPYTSHEEPRSISRDAATFLQDFHVRRKREVISLPHSFVSFQRVLYKEKGAR